MYSEVYRVLTVIQDLWATRIKCRVVQNAQETRIPNGNRNPICVTRLLGKTEIENHQLRAQRTNPSFSNPTFIALSHARTKNFEVSHPDRYIKNIQARIPYSDSKLVGRRQNSRRDLHARWANLVFIHIESHLHFKIRRHTIHSWIEKQNLSRR